MANVGHKGGTLLHLRPIDPSNLDTANDPNAYINIDLVADGLAPIDGKGCKYLNVYLGVRKKLEEAVTEAERQRYGIYEFGGMWRKMNSDCCVGVTLFVTDLSL